MGSRKNSDVYSCAARSSVMCNMGFSKIRGTFLGVPIVRVIIYWCLCWGSLILANYHMRGSHYVEQGGVKFLAATTSRAKALTALL